MNNPKSNQFTNEELIKQREDQADRDTERAKSNKFTPGPWVVLYSSNAYPSIHAGPTQVPVATLSEYNNDTQRENFDNAEANARLIAAAPELLRELELLQSWLIEKQKVNFAADNKIALDGINFAIAKATGGAE